MQRKERGEGKQGITPVQTHSRLLPQALFRNIRKNTLRNVVVGWKDEKKLQGM